MENKLSIASALPEVEAAQALARPASERRPQAQPVAASQPDLRLVIEDQAGAFVYKTIDRRTGEVVLQLPREEVLRMRETQAYEAGAVITTQA